MILWIFFFQKDPNVRLVTLYTLNNLMPCIDRQRVADTTMRIINTHFDVNTAGQSLSTTYLLILQNMAAFSSAHSTLLSLDIIPLLDQVATLAVKDHNKGIESAHRITITTFTTNTTTATITATPSQ